MFHEPIPFYCKAASFNCNCCGYATDIYSNSEWLTVTEEKICKKCKGAYNRHFEQGVIYRHDLNDAENDISLHIQFTTLPDNKQDCGQCIKRNSIYWTESLIFCQYCNKNSMIFSVYTEGKNIADFKEWCRDSAKPAHPIMEWIDEHGHLIYVFSGWGDSFSAS